ncbi:hypothetical protein ACXYMT_07885 [Salinimicrobium sp. CAU 1759]
MRVFVLFSGLIVLLIFPAELTGQAHVAWQKDILEIKGKQERSNHSLIKEIYEILQEKSTTLKDFESLTSNIDWEEIVLTEGMDAWNHISLSSLLRNEWMSIVIKDLQFHTADENSILVTGFVHGRQPTECEFISYSFEHYWLLEDERITGFKE